MTEMPESAGQIPAWTLGWRLQRSLAHAGLSVETIAEDLGVSRSTVSRWLNDRGEPRAAFVKLWALRTGVPIEWLTGTDPTGRGGREVQRNESVQVSAGFRSGRNPTFRIAAAAALSIATAAAFSAIYQLTFRIASVA